MNSTSTNTYDLGGVTADDIKQYLTKNGWKLAPFKRPELLVFEGPMTDEGEPILQILPSSEKASDFALRARELISALGVIENRPGEDVLRDINKVRLPEKQPLIVTPATSGLKSLVVPGIEEAPGKRTITQHLAWFIQPLTERVRSLVGKSMVRNIETYLRRHPGELHELMSRISLRDIGSLSLSRGGRVERTEFHFVILITHEHVCSEWTIELVDIDDMLTAKVLRTN